MPIQDRTVEEVSDLKSFDKVSSPIVVPNDCAAARPNFQEMMEGYDDITQVLTNIGDGFNSEDDSGKGSDIGNIVTLRVGNILICVKCKML